jgi:hypothetical protein
MVQDITDIDNVHVPKKRDRARARGVLSFTEFENFTKKGQDCNKEVTGNDFNTHVGRMTRQRLFAGKHSYGKAEKDNHAITNISNEGVMIWQTSCTIQNMHFVSYEKAPVLLSWRH